MLTPCLKNLSCRLQTHSNSLAWYLRSHNWGPTCFNPALSWTLEHVYLNILQMLTPLSLNSRVSFTSSNSNFLQRASHTPPPPQAFPATVIATTSELFQNILYCSSVTQHVLLYWNGHFMDMSSLLLRLNASRVGAVPFTTGPHTQKALNCSLL